MGREPWRIEAMADRLPGGSAEIECAVAAMDDWCARIEVSAKRAFLAEISATCASPIVLEGAVESSRLALRALLFSLDGAQSMIEWFSVALSSDIGDAERAGVELARRMSARGAD